MLTGRLFATPDDLSALLAVLMVKGAERERLMRLNREQNKPGWLQEHSSPVPEELKTLVDHENKAVAIYDFEALVIPGLLQTSDYARRGGDCWALPRVAGGDCPVPEIFAALADCALDEGQSIDLIAELAVELYADGEGDQHQV